MSKFWLDNYMDLFSTENFKFNTNAKVYNVISLVIIIIGLLAVFKTKKVKYFGAVIILLSLIILLRIKDVKFIKEGFDEPVANKFYLSAKLTKDALKGTNSLSVNNSFNINKGDIILLDDSKVSESIVVSDTYISQPDQVTVIVLTNKLKNTFLINQTQLFKISDSIGNVIPPQDGSKSSSDSNNSYVSSPEQMAINHAPPAYAPNNGNRIDVNLELGTYRGPNDSTYQYQGPPNGPLECRKSTVNNPMGTVNITEYGATPTMYGTCNVGDSTVLPDGKVVTNDYLMDSNFESTVSMRVNDLLFHKGNAQSRFSPMYVDTIPDNQEAFAHFCYRSPTNLVNPKYASIFVNDPEKFKMVTALAKATGTENGGGGGGGGR